MNHHLNIFNNYREVEHPRENNLTRAFLITLKQEPQLLREFLQLTANYQTWDEPTISFQFNNPDITGIEHIYGITLTSEKVSEVEISRTSGKGVKAPLPDFLISTGNILIVAEVKKHEENAVAQMKNQVRYLLDMRSEKDLEPEVTYLSITWTEILTKLILPYEKYNSYFNVRTPWASEFKEYVSLLYGDWLPSTPLSDLTFAMEEKSVNRQMIIKRLIDIQALTSFGRPEKWIGGRMTQNLNFEWATEALVSLDHHNKLDNICITLWPANTKYQGDILFDKDIG